MSSFGTEDSVVETIDGNDVIIRAIHPRQDGAFSVDAWDRDSAMTTLLAYLDDGTRDASSGGAALEFGGLFGNVGHDAVVSASVTQAGAATGVGLERFTFDGEPDPGFGGETLKIGASGDSWHIYGSAEAPDSRLVIFISEFDGQRAVARFWL